MHQFTISLNSHYVIVIKNPLDNQQIATLSKQMYAGKSQFLIEAFQDATKDPYDYLLIDLKPETPDFIRICTSITSTPIVYK